jgi:hypothetical protein
VVRIYSGADLQWCGLAGTPFARQCEFKKKHFSNSFEIKKLRSSLLKAEAFEKDRVNPLRWKDWF